jgi:hypothetical protein
MCMVRLIAEATFKVRAVPSEATKYWFYSRECARQAEEAMTEDRRNRLMELSRTWTEAAQREESAERAFAAVQRSKKREPWAIS